MTYHLTILTLLQITWTNPIQALACDLPHSYLALTTWPVWLLSGPHHMTCPTPVWPSPHDLPHSCRALTTWPVRLLSGPHHMTCPTTVWPSPHDLPRSCLALTTWPAPLLSGPHHMTCHAPVWPSPHDLPRSCLVLTPQLATYIIHVCATYPCCTEMQITSWSHVQYCVVLSATDMHINTDHKILKKVNNGVADHTLTHTQTTQEVKNHSVAQI